MFAFVAFFSKAQDINRGLGHATAMAHADNDEKLKREYERLLAKARELVGRAGENDGLSQEARRLVTAKLVKSPLLR